MENNEVPLHIAVKLGIAGFVVAFWGAIIYGCLFL